MKIKVNRRQLDLLLKNLHWLNGLTLTMNGETFKTVVAGSSLVNEGRMFMVDLWFGANNTKHIVFAHNSAEAMVLAGKMFPKANVFHATPIKGKLC
jgi:hypothetical protein